MTDNKKEICKQFELLVWLYIDGDLSIEAIRFWNEHIFQCEACNTTLTNIELLSNQIREKLTLDISDEEFNRIISDVTSEKKLGIVNNISNRWGKKEKWKIGHKIAFATTIAIVSSALFLILRSQNEYRLAEESNYTSKKILSQESKIDVQRLEEMVYGKNWDVEIGLLEKDIHYLENNSNGWFTLEGGKK